MADYIDREALLTHQYNASHSNWPQLAEMVVGVEDIEDAPAADVAPVVHGQWIEDHDYLKCPECGVMVKWDFTFFDIGNWNYCPNCGEKMDGGDNIEDEYFFCTGRGAMQQGCIASGLLRRVERADKVIRKSPHSGRCAGGAWTVG